MEEIGIRELKANLSAILRKVEGGTQVRVTLRGRPVADIVPAGPRRGDDLMRALVAEGRLTPATSRLRRTASPVRTGHSATAEVLAERDDER